MNIPKLISKNILRELAGPNETHAVRVLLHDAPNQGLYRLRLPRRIYLFEKDGTIGVHALDIPVSVWMEGNGIGRFRDNLSVAMDFRGAKVMPWSIQVVPWKGAVLVGGPDYLTPLRELLSNLGAPDEVIEAFKAIDAGDIAKVRELARLSGDVPLVSDEPETIVAVETKGPTPGEERTRKMREAKAAKKAARQLEISNA